MQKLSSEDKGHRLALTIVTSLALCSFTDVWAQQKSAEPPKNAPPSYTAAPEVYKLISENENFRVILVTWKPGQRDAWHSHAGPLAAYRLTDCKQRAYTPDGKSQDRESKQGTVNYTPMTASHSLENIGKTDCRILIVEKK
jgi:quercetin dioxygenase-like cupin family protein